MKLKLFFIIGLILLIVPLRISCTSSPSPSLNSVIKAATNLYRFSIPEWEINSIAGEVQQTYTDRNLSANDTQTVIDYFNAVQNNTLPSSQESEPRDTVESIIELQIRDVLRQDGITNPFGGIFGFNFPPIVFKLAEPPHLLVVSPRNQIKEIQDVLLLQNMTVDQMNDIETQIDAAGYSALVVELGGLGAVFPTFVNSNSSLPDVLDAAAEEWTHQYLAFKPLGFRYVLDLLDISRNEDVIAMNESLAGIVSSEIGSQVYSKYYATYFPNTNPTPVSNVSSFDFNAAMRQIRQTVDSYLAGG